MPTSNPYADVLVATTNFQTSMQALQQPKSDLDTATATATQTVATAQAALKSAQDASGADVAAKSAAYNTALADARAKLKLLDDALVAAQITPAS